MSATPEPFASCAHVLVVEDLDGVREGLIEVARQAFPGAQISACATLHQAESWLREHPGHTDGRQGNLVALVDLGLPDGNGATLVRKLAELGPQVMPIVTTIFDDDVSLCDAIAAGAQGYLLKEHPPETLVRYLLRIEQGEPPMTPRMARRVLECMQRMATDLAGPEGDEIRLSPRETEVLGIIGRGLRVSEAARVLGLTDQTVASYVKSIYRKLNISSRAEAALEAQRRKLV